MRKICLLFLLIAVAFSFSSCAEEQIAVNSDDYLSEIEETTLLAESFDYEIASGYDKDKNFYQLVANESEDYSGLVVKVAVIKNNEILVNPSSKTPFNDKSGMLFGKTVENVIENKEILYVGNGCFFFDECLWNVNMSNKYFHGMDSWKLETTFSYNGEDTTICNNDGMFLYHSQDKFNPGKFLLVDSNTMTTKTIVLDEFQETISGGLSIHSVSTIFGPYSEGLMSIRFKYGSASYEGFYDVEGNKVIDLYNYDVVPDMIGFKNGKASFEIKNNAGTSYMITIDKTGKVLKSTEIIEED